MAFTAKDVQALREKTGCGMMDCKKALVECDGDMDAAVDFLREKGLASQAKKAGRIAAEGTVCTYTANGVGVMVELNAETDFVANGEEFKALANKVAVIIAEQNPADMDALLACEKDGLTVEGMVQELFLAIRENIKIRRFVRIEGKVVSVDEIKALASLPSKEVLVAKLLGSMSSPIQGFASVLNGNLSGLARVLQAIADTKAAAGE